ncbi:uncharacterized membrane protein YFL067W-like [Vanessa cardui]|uniref:uncharacterized membrane protein YFL067W-like n=1 Tax=Vanessa cardui TaxID=171605 RepID=UPI001F12C0ED|nr:uncharacterized membrane protein YFL067W-like [Vanessa cardui]
MKIVILAVLSYVILLDAHPLNGLSSVGKGIGSEIGSGLGTGVGTGAGYGINGVEAIGDRVIGLGLGAVELGSGIVEGMGTGFATALDAGLRLAGIDTAKEKKSRD